MAYIETLAPRGFDPYALFVYPYQEGMRNLRQCADQPELWGRIKQAAAGIFLLIPLINTIVFVILRALTAVPVFNDDPYPIETEIPANIKEHNEVRDELYRRFLPDRTPEFLDQIYKVEKLAVKDMTLVHIPEVDAHLKLSANRHRDLIALDGKIHGARYSRALAEQEGVPSAAFTQVGGAHQYRGGNHLCGYYALFYMYQAVSGAKEFANRDALHPMLVRWTKMIAKKRALSWLASHRDRQIPPSMQISVRGLVRDDIQYLIDNDPDLECLRTTDNCFVIGMDDLRFQHDEKRLWAIQQHEELRTGQRTEIEPYPINVIQPIGNKALKRKFPLYFIVRESDMHYYFIWAEKPWEFKVVHSLGTSIHNSMYFCEDTFFDIAKCLWTEIQAGL